MKGHWYVVVLITFVLFFSFSFIEVSAIKASGVDVLKFGSFNKRIVCGDVLCSEQNQNELGNIEQQGFVQDPRGAPGPGPYEPTQYEIDIAKGYQNTMWKNHWTPYNQAMHDEIKKYIGASGQLYSYMDPYKKAMHDYYKQFIGASGQKYSPSSLIKKGP